VPQPDSAEEKAWFSFASQLINTFKGQACAFELVNEIAIDSHQEDMVAGPDGEAPMIRFLQRLAAHLTAEKHLSRDGSPLPLYAGGFTRMDQPKMQNNPVLLSFMKWLSESPLIFGVNFHIHQLDLDQFQKSLAHVRKHIPNKPFAITEYSLVWKYKAHLGDKLSEGKNAAEFCKTFNRSPKLTVVDYLNEATKEPVTQKEWHAFLATCEWFDPQFISKSYALMSQYGVTLATYGFSHGPRKETEHKRTKPLTASSDPWALNMIFPYSWVQNNPDGSAPHTYGFYDDWIRIQQNYNAGK
jgi:hypothetical protein